MTDLREAIARAIYDAENGLDGDNIATMLIEDFRITGANFEECRAQVLIVCQKAADASLAAIEASGFIVVPAEPTEEMARAARLREIAWANRNRWLDEAAPNPWDDLDEALDA